MNNINNLEIIKFKKFEKFKQIDHFISTRKGGVSEAPFNELNLGLHVGDDEEIVLKNRKILSHVCGIDQENFVYLNQTHSANVLVANENHRGAGVNEYEASIKDMDAAITNISGICLVVLVADCAPILFFDPVQKVVGAVHAGWRGTMKGIVQKTVEKMEKEYSCIPQDVAAGIGPSIGPCCYEITDENLLGKWEGMFQAKDKVVVIREGKKFLDLWQANKIQLMRSGVKEVNIEISGICTSCNTNKFYSYKKEGATGRFGAGIFIK